MVNDGLSLSSYSHSSIMIAAAATSSIEAAMFVNCGSKTFRILPLYNNLKPVEVPAKELNVASRIECSTKCYHAGACTGFFFHTVDGLCSLYKARFHSMSFVKKTETQAYEHVLGVPSDCYDVMMQGGDTSGLYTVVPGDNGSPISVYCELSSTDGGWLVIQRRTDGSEDFYRTWNEYRDGFGDLSNEFWLGNTNIHRITSQGPYDLRIDLEDRDGNATYALYKNFSVASEQDFFKLRLGAFSGDAGDGLTYHKGYNFSAKDNDLDSSSKACSREFTGAWWYNSCHESNLNGLYLAPGYASSSLSWSNRGTSFFHLRRASMKIRPMQF
ncbi:fibrinogen-like protein A [Gigantopelta aegis]|uniref:fibrinogen-like protein A n=1 Tax=Gigantopelta aegis TaxID=1735272 RepID=UPI001B88D74F|nr:fibrinogen-like protein A [Gigantopelta aegis]